MLTFLVAGFAVFPLQSIGKGGEHIRLGDVVGMKDSQRLSVSTSQRVKKPHTEVGLDSSIHLKGNGMSVLMPKRRIRENLR